jgi:serine/threonine-protein kinase
VLQAAEALDRLHEGNVVHCDLKPANILLDKEGRPHITDFGLSRILEGRPASTHGEYVAGTPSYMSPEQAEGNIGGTRCGSDVYSLGAILYHVLTGKPPFSGDDVSQLLRFVIGRPPPQPREIRRDIPVGLEAICLKCLEKKQADRYASAAALAADLRNFLSGVPLEAQRPNLRQRLLRWALREPALAGRTAAMAALFGVELIWYHALKISGPTFHQTVMILVPIWAFVSWAFQRLERRPECKPAARVLWAVTDAAALTVTLVFSRDAVASPAVFCYPLLIAVSGLWFHMRFVWLCTVLAMLSYGLLWAYSLHRRPEVVGPYDRYLVFLACLCILGFVITRLVRRVQILSRRLQCRDAGRGSEREPDETR